jgi:uncharacterized membrane protein
VDAVIEFLLKYRPAAFQRGALAYDPVLPPWGVVALAVLGVALAWWTMARSTHSISGASRLTLGALRLGSIGLLAWCLCRPVLVVAEALDQRNIVAVVVDDSRSMRIADVNGQPRSSIPNRLIGGPDSALQRALSTRYQVRVYRTSARGRVSRVDSLPYDGRRSELLSTITRVEDELDGAPVSGVVVLTDGADNGSRSDDAPSVSDRLSTLRARGIPVYPIGIGSERFEKDVEVASIAVPRTALRNATVLLDIVVTHRGFGGTAVPVVVEDSGRVLATTTARLARDVEATPIRLRVPLTDAGARLLTVRVPPQAAELIAENNARRAMVTVRDRREKILHVEGEPRPGLKFARRAVDGDRQLQLVTLLRSAKDKYLRLGVSDSLELMSGFPTTRAALFAYRAVVLGSIEASFFTGDQLRMLNEFVSERGGGLLLLGGRGSFAEGGYAGTALSDASPVDMEVRTRATTELATEISAVPTPEGLRHPALQVARSDSLLSRRWRTLPPLTSVNLLTRVKPGATVLLQGRVGDRATTRPLLVAHRYGRGRVLALGAQDDWIWQMHADIAVQDSTHELLWQQMLRWLVNDVPDRVDVSVDEERVPDEAVPVRVVVRDSAFVRQNGASVTATVREPSGDEQRVPLTWSGDRDGEYTGSFLPTTAGMHLLSVSAGMDKDTVLASDSYVHVTESTAESFGAERRDGLLQQLADETGGRRYTPERALDVARDLRYSTSGATEVRRLDLWDAPLVLVLLLGLLGAEWVLRRRWGLA